MEEIKFRKEFNKIQIAIIIICELGIILGLYSVSKNGFNLNNVTPIVIGISIIMLTILD